MIGLQFDPMDTLAEVDERLEALSIMDVRPLLEGIGAEVTSQTQRRISSEKESPEGQPWDAWSEAYAKTRHEGQSLMRSTDALLESLQWELQGEDVLVGSNLVYAGPGQKLRPFLGLSAENERDVEKLVHAYLEGLL